VIGKAGVGGSEHMNILRVILIVSEVLFLLLLLFPPSVESRPFAQAIVAYHQDPSSQDQNELEHPREVVRGMGFHQSLFIAGLLAANSVGLFYVSRRNHRQAVA
jgi:hypothetical protein